jgi:hypothetical protein
MVWLLMPGCFSPQVFDLHYADGSHLKGFNGVDQVWVSGLNPLSNAVPTDTGRGGLVSLSGLSWLADWRHALQLGDYKCTAPFGVITDCNR